jgi:hypothetical protein
MQNRPDRTRSVSDRGAAGREPAVAKGAARIGTTWLTAMALAAWSCAASGSGDGATAPDGMGATPSALVLVAGGDQEGDAGEPLPDAIVIRATNVLGAAVAGALVSAETSADGEVSPATQVTGPDGRASFRWTLSTTPGSQTLRIVSGARVLAVSAMARSVELGTGFRPAQFALIPAGSFQMGTVSGGDGDERPVRQVTLSAFRMQKTEVTQGQWR